MVFPPAADGRPTIYDFLWEHAGPLLNHLNEKTVRVYTHTDSLSSTHTKSHTFQVAKLANEKRFNINATANSSRAFDATLSVQHLDHFVNAYNILFDSHFSNLVFDTPGTHIDFSKAGDHTIVIETNAQNEDKIRAFFSHTAIPPRIRTLRFGIKQPLQAKLDQKASRNPLHRTAESRST